MKDSEIRSEIRAFGVPARLINDLLDAHQMRRIEVKAPSPNAAQWSKVLAPLTGQIRSMQSSRSRWSKDVLLSPIYSAYLALLIKARDKIKAARYSGPLLSETTVRQAALDRGIAFDGKRWPAWVPEKIRHQFILAFQELYDVTLPAAGRASGKRMIPFSTARERSVGNKRWDLLLHRLLAEQEAYAGTVHKPYLDALRAALTAIEERHASLEAPVNWEHLLSARQRTELAAWRNDTMDGLSAPTEFTHAQEVLRAVTVERAAMSEERRVTSQRRKQDYARRYMADRRARIKASRPAKDHRTAAEREEDAANERLSAEKAAAWMRRKDEVLRAEEDRRSAAPPKDPNAWDAP